MKIGKFILDFICIVSKNNLGVIVNYNSFFRAMLRFVTVVTILILWENIQPNSADVERQFTNDIDSGNIGNWRKNANGIRAVGK